MASLIQEAFVWGCYPSHTGVQQNRVRFSGLQLSRVELAVLVVLVTWVDHSRSFEMGTPRYLVLGKILDEFLVSMSGYLKYITPA